MSRSRVLKKKEVSDIGLKDLTFVLSSLLSFGIKMVRDWRQILGE